MDKTKNIVYIIGAALTAGALAVGMMLWVGKNQYDTELANDHNASQASQISVMSQAIVKLQTDVALLSQKVMYESRISDMKRNSAKREKVN